MTLILFAIKLEIQVIWGLLRQKNGESGGFHHFSFSQRHPNGIFYSYL